MKNNILKEIKYWDWKSILIGLGTLLVIAVGLYFYLGNAQADLNYRKAESYKGIIHGKVIKVENVKHLSQSQYQGNRLEIVAYKITYDYYISGQNYVNTIQLNSSHNETLRLVARVKKKETSVIVKYDEKDPKKSVLKLK